ncbi:MAG: 3-alpha domain-containing protein, partial [Planctomycetia bacterium]
VQQTGRTGWYFRVLREGMVEAGERLVLVDRLHPDWTVAAANELMNHQMTDIEAARVLGACPALSTNWRETLARRVATGVAASTAGRLDGPSS